VPGFFIPTQEAPMTIQTLAHMRLDAMNAPLLLRHRFRTHVLRLSRFVGAVRAHRLALQRIAS